MTKRKGAERVWAEPTAGENGFTYSLTLTQGGYAIRIERQGYGQTITHDRLCRDGINVISAAMSLIERRERGDFE